MDSSLYKTTWPRANLRDVSDHLEALMGAKPTINPLYEAIPEHERMQFEGRTPTPTTPRSPSTGLPDGTSYTQDVPSFSSHFRPYRASTPITSRLRPTEKSSPPPTGRISAFPVPHPLRDTIRGTDVREIHRSGASTGNLNGHNGANMFSHAKHVRVYGGSFNATYVNGEDRKNNGVSSTRLLEPLFDRVSRNAILNAGGRADEVRCHPGTRETLIQLIEEWIQDTRLKRGPPIFWLSGPAGAGKTAIIQTIAERCIDRNELQANFFFFRPDGSRNTARPFVATLVSQIIKFDPTAKDAVERSFSTDPKLLDGSIEEQVLQLIIPSLTPLLSSRPVGQALLLIIDGLDECDSTLSQRHIIQAMAKLVSDKLSPCIILLASRREHNIEMAFHPIENLVKRIFLDETYLPDDDITLFVKDEFNRIKQSHPLAGTLKATWPSPSDIEDIVSKSSGQFIYAATVMRFLADSRASPAVSLAKVNGIMPVGKTSPFSQLDAIYSYILSQVEDWSVTYNILAVQLLLQDIGCNTAICDILDAYNWTSIDVIVSCVSELSALVQLERHGMLRFYHKSLEDFLLDKSRSTTYYIDVDPLKQPLLEALWRNTGENAMSVAQRLFSKLSKPNPWFSNALLTLSPPQWMLDLLCGEKATTMGKLEKLYMSDRNTLDRIIENFHANGLLHIQLSGGRSPYRELTWSSHLGARKWSQ